MLALLFPLMSPWHILLPSSNTHCPWGAQGPPYSLSRSASYLLASCAQAPLWPFVQFNRRCLHTATLQKHCVGRGLTWKHQSNLQGRVPGYSVTQTWNKHNSDSLSLSLSLSLSHTHTHTHSLTHTPLISPAPYLQWRGWQSIWEDTDLGSDSALLSWI